MKRNYFIGILLSLFILTTMTLYLMGVSKDTPSRVIPAAPETIEQVRLLMQVTEECMLPCFWGFMPGENTVDDVISFIQPERDLSHLEGQYILEYFFFEDNTDSILVSLNFWIDDNRLYRISGSIGELTRLLPENSIALPNLLRLLNSAEIYIGVNITTFVASIVVIDDSTGIMIQYILPFQVRADEVSPTSEEPVWLCPHIDHPYRDISVTLQNPQFETPISDSTALGRSMQTGDHYLTLEESVNGDVEAIIEQIIQDPDYCIETLTYRQWVEHAHGW